MFWQLCSVSGSPLRSMFSPILLNFWTLQVAMDPNDRNDITEGEWNSVGKGGKKQKKKLKNARTVTLQTFFIENGGWSPLSQSPGPGDHEEETKKNALELSEEEQVVKTSLLSFFTDLLLRLGPVKSDE